MSCPLEQQKRSNISAGTIADDELICRGAIDGTHGNKKTGNVRSALIEKRALAEGTLSIYRARGATGWDLGDVAAQLMSMGILNPVFKVIGVPAAELRNITIDEIKICVLDETECDQAGNHHSLHGHISPCRNHTPLNRSSDAFERIRLGVWHHYETANSDPNRSLIVS